MNFGFTTSAAEVEHWKLLFPERKNNLNMVILTLVTSEDGFQRQ